MKSKMFLAVAVLGLVAGSLLAQETITLDFEDQTLGSTNLPPSWSMVLVHNPADAGYVVGEGAYGEGKGGM